MKTLLALAGPGLVFLGLAGIADAKPSVGHVAVSHSSVVHRHAAASPYHPAQKGGIHSNLAYQHPSAPQSPNRPEHGEDWRENHPWAAHDEWRENHPWATWDEWRQNHPGATWENWVALSPWFPLPTIVGAPASASPAGT